METRCKPSVQRSGPSRLAANPKTWAVLLLGLAPAGYFWTAWASARSAERPIRREAPPLFEDAGICTNNGDSLRHARELEEVALAKMERYLFAPRDGVKAVRQCLEAEACYRVAGYTNEAKRVQRLAGRWKQRLVDDYLGHRLRLKLALRNVRVADALEEVRALRALLSHTPDDHPYSAWLAGLERRLADRGRVQEPSKSRER